MRQASAIPTTGMAEWKEGQPFPEGWEEMNLFKKACLCCLNTCCKHSHESIRAS